MTKMTIISLYAMATSSAHCSVVEDFLTNPYQVPFKASLLMQSSCFVDYDDDNDDDDDDNANMCVLLWMTVEMKRDRLNFNLMATNALPSRG